MTRAAPNASYTPGHLHTYMYTFKSHANPTTARKELFLTPTCQLFSLRAADGSPTAIPPRLPPRSGHPCRQHFSPWQEQIPLLHSSAGTLALPIASGNHQGNSVCPVKSGASHPPSLSQCPSFVKSLPEWKCLMCGQTVTVTATSSAKEWKKGYLHQDISHAQRFRYCRALGSLTYLHDLLIGSNLLLVETLDSGLLWICAGFIRQKKRDVLCDMSGNVLLSDIFLQNK